MCRHRRREEIDGVTTDATGSAVHLASTGVPVPAGGRPAAADVPRLQPGQPDGFWVDGDGRPRRLEADLEFHVESSGGPLGGSGYAYSAEVTMSFRGYGEPVDISPPPPADQISEWPPAA